MEHSATSRRRHHVVLVTWANSKTLLVHPLAWPACLVNTTMLQASEIARVAVWVNTRRHMAQPFASNVAKDSFNLHPVRLHASTVKLVATQMLLVQTFANHAKLASTARSLEQRIVTHAPPVNFRILKEARSARIARLDATSPVLDRRNASCVQLVHLVTLQACEHATLARQARFRRVRVNGVADCAHQVPSRWEPKKFAMPVPMAQSPPLTAQWNAWLAGQTANPTSSKQSAIAIPSTTILINWKATSNVSVALRALTALKLALVFPRSGHCRVTGGLATNR